MSITLHAWEPTPNVHYGSIAWVVPRCPEGHIYFGKEHRHICPKCNSPLYIQNVSVEEYETQKQKYFSPASRLFRFLRC